MVNFLSWLSEWLKKIWLKFPMKKTVGDFRKKIFEIIKQENNKDYFPIFLSTFSEEEKEKLKNNFEIRKIFSDEKSIRNFNFILEYFKISDFKEIKFLLSESYFLFFIEWSNLKLTKKIFEYLKIEKIEDVIEIFNKINLWDLSLKIWGNWLIFLMNFYKVDSKEKFLELFSNNVFKLSLFESKFINKNLKEKWDYEIFEILNEIITKFKIEKISDFNEVFSIIFSGKNKNFLNILNQKIFQKHLNSLEDLKIFCQNDELEDIFKIWNLSLFFIFLEKTNDINITKSKTILNFCLNNFSKNNAEENSFIFDYLNINNILEIEKYLENRNFSNILKEWKKENIIFLIEKFNLKKFEDFSQIEKTFTFIVHIEALKSLLEELKIKNKEEFFVFAKNKNIFNFLRKNIFTQEKNNKKILNLKSYLKNFFNLVWIENFSDFEEFFKKYNQEIITEFHLIETNCFLWRYSMKNFKNFKNTYNFLEKKVYKSDENTFILGKVNLLHPKFEEIFDFYIRKKQKSLMNLIEKVNLLNELDLDFNFNKIKTFSDYKDKNWEINYDEIRIDFQKHNKNQKQKNKLENFIKTKNNSWLEEFLYEFAIKYYENIFNKKIKEKILQVAQNYFKIKSNEIDDKLLERKEFIEVFKMFLTTYYNKKNFCFILEKYLKWEFKNPYDLMQFKTEENKIWLEKYLPNQEKREIWLAKNTKIFEVKDLNLNSEEENLNLETKNYFLVAILKIQELNSLWFNFKDKFANFWELQKYFNVEIKRNFKEKIFALNKKDLFEDLEFQIKQGNKEQNRKNSEKKKKIKFIKIEKELDPLNVMMMGNRVNWSCLNYNSYLKHFYSVVANAVDSNKWVFYIKDGNDNILWRVLVAIWNDKKISRFALYSKNKTNIDLNIIFNEYFLELAEKLKLEINWDSTKIQNINSEYWYNDMIYRVKKTY